MMTAVDPNTVLLAAIAVLVPLSGQWLAYRSQREQARENAAAAAAGRAATNVKVEQVHEVVNSKHAEALATIEALKNEVRSLNAGGTTLATRGPPVPGSVTLGADGRVSVTATNPLANAVLVPGPPPGPVIVEAATAPLTPIDPVAQLTPPPLRPVAPAPAPAPGLDPSLKLAGE